MSNVITKVEWTNRGGTQIFATHTDIPELTTYKWRKQDISGQGAGRTITSDAWKNLQAKARTLDCTWENKNASVIRQVLTIFDTEYVYVTYFDAITGTHQRKHFYMGDMAADMYSYVIGGTIWSMVSISLIQGITDKI